MTTSVSPSSKPASPPLAPPDDGRRHRRNILLLIVGAVALAALGYQFIVSTNHSGKVGSAVDNAAAVADSYSYEQINDAWAETVVTDDGSLDAALADMLHIGDGIVPSAWSNINETMVVGYQVETFGRTSCVLMAVAPSGTAVESTSGACGTAALPSAVQTLVDR